MFSQPAGWRYFLLSNALLMFDVFDVLSHFSTFPYQDSCPQDFNSDALFHVPESVKRFLIGNV